MNLPQNFHELILSGASLVSEKDHHIHGSGNNIGQGTNGSGGGYGSGNGWGDGYGAGCSGDDGTYTEGFGFRDLPAVLFSLSHIMATAGNGDGRGSGMGHDATVQYWIGAGDGEGLGICEDESELMVVLR